MRSTKSSCPAVAQADTAVAQVWAFGGSKPRVLQHACYVYAAEFAPAQAATGGLPLLATAGYDRSIRLWDVDAGQMLMALQVLLLSIIN
jgi:hypothetical protein